MNKISDRDKQRLGKIFYSPEFGFRNARALYLRAIKEGIMNLSYSDVKWYYDNQEVVQMFAPLQKPKKSYAYKIDTVFPSDRVYFDTMFFKRYKIYVINAIDLGSRYAWTKAVYIKQRPDETKSSVTSKQTSSLLQQVSDDLASKGYRLSRIVCSGSEFMGHFYDLAQNLNINIQYADAGDHQRLAPIDAFCRTLRILVEKWVASSGGKSGLMEAIPKLTGGYNNSPHSSLKGVSPAEYITSTKLQSEKEKDYSDRMRGYSDSNDDGGLKVGDHVRVITRTIANPFKKIRANWSRGIFQIQKIVGQKYEVSNGKSYRVHELLLIPHPELVMKPPPSSRQVEPQERMVEGKETQKASQTQPRQSVRLAGKHVRVSFV